MSLKYLFVITLLTNENNLRGFSCVKIIKQSFQKPFRPGHITHFVKLAIDKNHLSSGINTQSPTKLISTAETTNQFIELNNDNINDNFIQSNIIKNINDTIDLVFLPGFGVGTYHYDKNMESVIKSCFQDKQLQVQCHSLDWLGQSKSWPVDKEASHQLRYCANNWCEQLEWYLENEVNNPNKRVFLIGNSLGGFIAVQLAKKRPDLFTHGGLILLNPTPIWSFQPPSSDTKSWRPFGWTANLPAPTPLQWLGSNLFKLMRDEATIKRMLSEVYHDKSQIDNELIKNIQEGSSNPLGPDAFTSIMFAPKMEKSFEEVLVELNATLPVLLLYGAQDPWVTPFWGDRAYRRLIHRNNNNHHYSNNINTTTTTTTNKKEEGYEHTKLYYIIPSGHCPHHETSEIVNELITDFVALSSNDFIKSNQDININNNQHHQQHNDLYKMKTEYFWKAIPLQSQLHIENNTNNISLNNKNNNNKNIDVDSVKVVMAKQSYGIYDNQLMSRIGALIDDYKV